MNATAIITELDDVGITLARRGEDLRVEGPADLLTSDLRALLTNHKRELLGMLRHHDEIDRQMAALVPHRQADGCGVMVHPASIRELDAAGLLSTDEPGPVKRAAVLLSSIEDAEVRSDLQFRFDERAAICEYDANMSRREAARQAYIELTRALKLTREIVEMPR